MGQSRHFDRGPATSDLPPGTDIVSPRRHVSNLPKTELAGMAALGAKQTLGKTPTFAKWHERRERLGDGSKGITVPTQATVDRDAVRTFEAHPETRPAPTAWSARRPG